MNYINKILIGLILCMSFVVQTTDLNGQVTIGSGIPPVTGALLDLKEYDDAPALAGGRTATKGLGMPRVKLNSLTGDLAQSLNATATAGSLNGDEHMGLLVYHIDRCTFAGSGIYVWNGTEWQPLQGSRLAGVKFNQSFFDLPSGHDARALSAQNLSVTWSGGTAPQWTSATSAGFTTPVSFNTPGTTGTVGASPFAMSILPNAMPTPNAAAPWVSRQSTFTFTDPECLVSKEVIFNQTNYALKANNQFVNSNIYTITGNGSFNVQSNANWKTIIHNPDMVLNQTTGTGSPIPATGGTTIKNTTTPPLEPISYIVTSDTKYYTDTITFQDPEAPKRFPDVKVSIFNCNPDLDDPTLERWALRAGFTQAQIDAVLASTDDTPQINVATPNTPFDNTIQMHLDQGNGGGNASGVPSTGWTNRNIFFSADFGPAGRWMIVNLAATGYTTVGRTGTDGTRLQVFGASPSSGNGNNVTPFWGYPNGGSNATTSITYDNNKRMGLLYNWAAATNSKGNTTTGLATITDGGTNHAKRQGICPNGWYLPSDYDWTMLENEIQTNTAKYSSTPDIGGILATPGTSSPPAFYILGAPMKDICQPALTTAGSGTSNVISTVKHGGISIMLAGHARGATSADYGVAGTIWSASGGDVGTQAFARVSSYNAEGYIRISTDRFEGYSVRCKKN